MSFGRLRALYQGFRSQQVEAKCGHTTRTKVHLKAFGGECFLELPVKDGKTSYCWDCLEAMTILCAWCGEPIFIGDPITLYSPTDENFEVPDYAVVYNWELRQLVGCLRMNCADSGAGRAGFWVPPGKVFRVVSPAEMCMQGGAGVFVSDVTDIKEALALQEVFDAAQN